MNESPIIILCGTTASGKSALALEISKRINSVIVNCDSMQIYKNIQILTAQPTENDLLLNKHELYNYVNPEENYSVARWIQDVLPIIKDYRGKGITPIIVGGTGFFINTLIYGLSTIPVIPKEFLLEIDKEIKKIGVEKIYNQLKLIDPTIKFSINDYKRILRSYSVLKYTDKPFSYWNDKKDIYFPITDFKVMYLDVSREQTYYNCNVRFDQMLKRGVIDEIESLMHIDENNTIVQAHGFKTIRNYIKGDITYNDMSEEVKKITRNYVKRQISWFKNKLKNYHKIQNINDFNNIFKD